jgi:hypothetical protein
MPAADELQRRRNLVSGPRLFGEPAGSTYAVGVRIASILIEA